MNQGTLNILRNALAISEIRLNARLQLEPLHKPTSKRQAKAGHKYCRQLRAKMSNSMLDMGNERFHRTPVNDERTKTLLSAYYKRKGNKS
jgi:hypothetical protein